MIGCGALAERRDIFIFLGLPCPSASPWHGLVAGVQRAKLKLKLLSTITLTITMCEGIFAEERNSYTKRNGVGTGIVCGCYVCINNVFFLRFFLFSNS